MSLLPSSHPVLHGVTMIIWVRIETLGKYGVDDRDFKVKRRLEIITGIPCLILHVSQMTPEVIVSLKPQALLLSGCGTFFKNFSPEIFYGFEDTINTLTDVPTIGFCASHQLMGIMFNQGFRNLSELQDEMMRPLHPGEPDVTEPSADAVGYFSEEGFYPVKTLKSDPLLDHLPAPFIVRQSHYAEIKTLPADFDLIATNDHCRIQAMKHKTRPLYGTQFHPEYYIDAYPHGRTILENFFRMAGILGAGR